MDSEPALGTALTSRAALVLFSGGQDSATVLAWAMSQYDRVETVGFHYGQKHLIEMGSRPIIRKLLQDTFPDWRNRLGPDHLVKVDLVGQIAKGVIPFQHNATDVHPFPGSRYIPGRNLIMLSMSASIAFRRRIMTLACGTSETEYSGYPDCRRQTMNAVELAINASSGLSFQIECPLMDLDKAGVWRLAQTLGGDRLVEIIRKETHTCYEGSRDELHEWGYGCSDCDACRLRKKGWCEFARGLVSD
jgi:7-cyano-7-deazaguanine synthase